MNEVEMLKAQLAEAVGLLRKKQEYLEAPYPCGAYSYGSDGTARTALAEVKDFLARHAQDTQPAAGEPVATVLSSRAGNDTSTIDKALPDGMKLYAAPPAVEHGDEPVYQVMYLGLDGGGWVDVDRETMERNATDPKHFYTRTLWVSKEDK